MNNWKQPIPTNLDLIFGNDYRANLLYRELIYRACNKDSIVSIDGKKHIKLLRGQVLFGANIFAKRLCHDARTTSRCLDRVQDNYQLVTNQRNHDYTIVTILNYDSIVSLDQPFDQPMTNQRPTSDQPVTTSKSVKSVKSVKNINSSEVFKDSKDDIELQGIVEHFNKTFNRKVESTAGFKANYLKWRKIHTAEKIKAAITNAHADVFWKDKIDLSVLFRFKNPRGEDVDYIEKFFNAKPTLTTNERLYNGIQRL